MILAGDFGAAYSLLSRLARDSLQQRDGVDPFPGCGQREARLLAVRAVSYGPAKVDLHDGSVADHRGDGLTGIESAGEVRLICRRLPSHLICVKPLTRACRKDSRAVPSTPKIRTLHRAAQTLGGEKALADKLRVKLEDIANWQSGTVALDDRVYFALLDIVAGRVAQAPTKPQQKAAKRSRT